MAERRYSANELCELYGELAIPHFQRGLVWGADSVALLLESLYLGTPCGSILLWEPESPSSHGVALGKAPRFLVIDGQQRIRSLYDVFGPDANGGDGAPADVSDAHRQGDRPYNDAVWCVNLARLPVAAFADRKGGRFRLFGLHRNPLLPSKDGQAQGLEDERRPLVPLKWFLAHAHQPDWLTAQSEGTTSGEAVEALLGSRDIVERLAGIRTSALFDIRVLGSDQTLKDVVSAYNRINSAGKRVEAEERAFATLVSVTDKAEAALEVLFDQTRTIGSKAHPDPQLTSAATPADRRDDLLHREKESRFGFKLFMRVFVINFAYHANRTIGSSSFSFDSVDSESLDANRDKLESILDSTVVALTGVARLLRDKLYCDDLRFLPDTASLWPVFQAVIRFPNLPAERPDNLASVALRLLLVELPSRDLLALCAGVNAASTPAELLRVFEGGKLADERIVERVRDGVGRAQSLTNRYSLLLYWLLRKRGARDFSYEANSCSHLADTADITGTIAERVLSASVRPEKQHLVPYKTLKALFALSGARPGQHEVNDIGNLTYISADQNGLDGLSSTPLKLKAEESANLEAHFLNEERVLRAFEDVCGSAYENSGRIDEARKSYRQLCAERKQAIASALVAWHDESRAAAAALAPSSAAPQPRLIVATLDDRLRRLGYPPPVTNALIRLEREGFKEAQGKDVAIRLALRRREKGRPKVLLIRVDLFADGRIVRLKVADPGLQERFRRRYPSITPTISKGALRRALDTTSEAGASDAASVLEWLSSAPADSEEAQ